MPSPLDTDFASAVDDLHRAISVFWQQARRNLAQPRSDLTLVRLEVLAFLERQGPSLVGEIASGAAVHPSTLTRVVDALAERKLVTRSVNRNDRRSIKVALSARGREELAKAHAAQLRLVADAVAHLEPAHRQQLFAAIPLLLETAEKLRPGAGDAGVSM